MDSDGLRLSDAAHALVGQPMFGLLTQANELEKKGIDVIHFEIGDSGFDSPRDAIDAASNALYQGQTHYVESRGMGLLHDAICDYLTDIIGYRPKESQVAVAPANALIDFFLKCVANAGDEIIVPDPCFPSYLAAIRYQNLIAVKIPLDPERNFRMDPKLIEGAISKKTKAIFINSPHNPTGSSLLKSDVEAIAQIASERNIFLFSDEVYAELLFDKVHFSPSYIDACKRTTVVLGSLSKSHAMAGWRSGFMIAPDFLVSKVELLIQTILSCIPPFVQIGSVVAFENGSSHVAKLRAAYSERATLLSEGLNKLSNMDCRRPDGGLYVFPKLTSSRLSAQDYARLLLQEEGVCVLPGNYFGESSGDYLRFSYGSTPVKKIKEALTRIERFHRKWAA